MKYKTTIFILLSIILVGVFILVRYGLFIVYWLTTPNALERTDVEKQLIEHFETMFETNQIVITPIYDMEKDTIYTIKDTIYTIYIQVIYRTFLVGTDCHLKKKQFI